MTVTTATVAPVSPTLRAIAEMMIENTGSHFLDSGGAYGRAWQHTRAKYGLDGGLPNHAFDGRPRPVADPEGDEIDALARAMLADAPGRIDPWGVISVSAFHWLTDRLVYEPDLDAKFQRWARLDWRRHDRLDYSAQAEEGSGYLAQVERFLARLGEVNTVTGFYGEGKPQWENTYNGEDALDRTLQFILFETQGDRFLPADTYVILQVHGGADVRGGYTAPRLFRGPSEAGEMFDNARIDVWCDGANLMRDDACPGQLSVAGEEQQPEFVRHFWSNEYGDSFLRRLDEGDETGEALVFARNDEEADAFAKGPDEYERRARITGTNITRRQDDEEDQPWLCPFDGTPLHVMGAIAG